MYILPYISFFFHFIQNIYTDVVHGSESYNIHILKMHVKFFVSCTNKSWIQNFKITTKLMFFYFQNFASKRINRSITKFFKNQLG